MSKPGNAAPSAPQKLTQDIMTAEVKCVTGDMTVRQAIQLLVENKISGAPLVDTMHAILSVVTQGDVLRLAALRGLDKPMGACVKDLPGTGNLATLSRKDTVTDAYKKFLSTKLHRLIVVDANGRLQGIVSRSDILRHIYLTSPTEAAPGTT
jgi:predicted transcriptional regulator